MSSHDNRFSILAEAENNQQSGARDQKKKNQIPYLFIYGLLSLTDLVNKIVLLASGENLPVVPLIKGN